MPKVTWGKTEAMRQEEAGKEFIFWLNAARQKNEISIEQMLRECNMTRMTYYRRKENPDTLTVEEIRKLAKATKVWELELGRKALLGLLGVA